LRYKFGNPQDDIELEDLIEMLSPTSSASCLSQTARLVLILHLFPLLSLVTSHQRTNKMTPDNLAICFSPALVCGSDQLADAKMTSIVRRILEAAVEHWPHGLRDACQTAPDSFAAALRPPPAAQDYEDPLQENYRDTSSHDSGERSHRIHLQDDEEPKSTFPARSDSLASPVKRKPAPMGVVPPPHATFPSRSVSQSYATQSNTLDFTDVRNALPYTESPPNVPSKISPPNPAPPAQNDLMKELRNSLATDIVKRKPVSSTASPGSTTSNDAPSVPPHRSFSARAPSPPKHDNAITFAKPTWAASSRTTSRQPSISNPAPPAPPTFARTPSPGLLKRMASIESVHNTAGGSAQQLVAPGVDKSGLRKSSVDDLKRIYEERAGLARAASVSSVGSGRRISNAEIGRRTS
jgi:Rho GTPase-activating protein 1